MTKGFQRAHFLGPLPITLSTDVYGPLPSIFPHNPLSWIYFGVKYLILYLRPIPHNPDIIVDYDTFTFKVRDRHSIDRLWQYGFFGKGNLSRSQPTWYNSTRRRLHLDPHDFELSNEEITKFRREERIKFKAERAKQQELLLKKRQNTITEVELGELHDINQILINFRKSNKLNLQRELTTPFDYDSLRPVDKQLVNPKTKHLQPIEHLQLQKVEVFFLKFALNIVNIDGFDLNQLFWQCCGTTRPLPTNQFIIEYVVYHHYRSLGWCARNGIKFGCSFILYKKGPPFSHAEHGIVILTDHHQMSWTTLQTISRVISSVRKNLVLAFVDIPNIDDFNEILNQDHVNLFKLFQLYKVNEIIYKRWTPNRTRD